MSRTDSEQQADMGDRSATPATNDRSAAPKQTESSLGGAPTPHRPSGRYRLIVVPDMTALAREVTRRSRGSGEGA